MGEVPNIVNQFLQVWSFRLANAHYQPASLRVDCGMVFRERVPPEWIESVTQLPIRNHRAVKQGHTSEHPQKTRRLRGISRRSEGILAYRGDNGWPVALRLVACNG
jgi:hypothetical protein